MAIAIMVVLPATFLLSVTGRLSGKGSDRTGSGGISAGVGAAMQELDRILSRPSVEHKVEVETPVLKREDAAGDD